MKNGKFYFVGSELVKIKSLSPSRNEAIVHNYDKDQDLRMDYDGLKLVAKPAYKIGDVAKMLERKSDTIRRWELKDWVPAQRQWQVGPKKFLRFYTTEQVTELRDMVESIHIGRPRKDARSYSDIPSAGKLKAFLRDRIKNIKE